MSFTSKGTRFLLNTTLPDDFEKLKETRLVMRKFEDIVDLRSWSSNCFERHQHLVELLTEKEPLPEPRNFWALGGKFFKGFVASESTENVETSGDIGKAGAGGGAEEGNEKDKSSESFCDCNDHVSIGSSDYFPCKCEKSKEESKPQEARSVRFPEATGESMAAKSGNLLGAQGDIGIQIDGIPPCQSCLEVIMTHKSIPKKEEIENKRLQKENDGLHKEIEFLKTQLKHYHYRELQNLQKIEGMKMEMAKLDGLLTHTDPADSVQNPERRRNRRCFCNGHS